MNAVPQAARTRRGAIVALDAANPAAGVIPFQYNPSRMQRTLTPRLSGEEAGRPDPMRLAGPPRESISLEIELDAADAPNGLSGVGVHPQLAALEMLLYPKAATVLRNAVLERLGVVEVLAPTTPLTLLVWGPKRVLPVRLTSFSAAEDAYDADLNPILATVSLGLDVLTYQDLPPTNLGYGLFLAHQVAKEAMATASGAAGVAVLAGLPGLSGRPGLASLPTLSGLPGPLGQAGLPVLPPKG